MVSMCGALRRVKDDPFAILNPAAIEAAYAEADERNGVSPCFALRSSRESA